MDQIKANLGGKICFVNESKGFFKENISNSPCYSAFPYKTISLIMNDSNDEENDQFLFTICYIELFGTMIDEEILFVSFCYRSRMNVLIMALIIFMSS